MEEDNVDSAAFLDGIDILTDNHRGVTNKPARNRSPIQSFVRDNWRSVLLLVQAFLIALSFGIMLTFGSGVAGLVYVSLLLFRWVNYGLAVWALFHDKQKWFAVIAGILYVACSLSIKLLVATA